MKVYISGKITGLPVKQYKQAFTEVELLIQSQGHEAINPVKITSHLPKGSSWKDYMKLCLSALLDAEAIYMQPNWIESKGARIEHCVADILELKIVYIAC